MEPEEEVVEYELTINRSELIPGGRGARIGYSDQFPDRQFLVIPMPRRAMPCRFADQGCQSPAVVRVRCGKGCVCYPDDREQLLCAHHWYKAEPLGNMEVIEEL